MPPFLQRDVLPYFKKFQDFVGDVDNKEKFHGTGGPMGVMPTAQVQVVHHKKAPPYIT